MTEPEEVDPRSFAEEVNVVPQMPANFHANLASSKWKDRKEALDDFLVVLQKAIRIQDVPELGDTIKALAEKMKDVNINCVITAANCLEALAKGLGSSFARYKEVTIPPILDRMKERKPSVTDALGTALDAIFASVRSHVALYLLLTKCIDDDIRHHRAYHPSVEQQEPPSQRRDRQVHPAVPRERYEAALSRASQASR